MGRLKEKEGEGSAAVVKAARPSAAQQQRAAQNIADAKVAEQVEAVNNESLVQGVESQTLELSSKAIPDNARPLPDPCPNSTSFPVGIPKEVIPAMRKAFSNLCTSPSGVLFENSLVQVGVKHEYVGAQGRISIFFGNLGTAPLKHFKVHVDECDHLRMQKQGTEGLLH